MLMQVAQLDERLGQLEEERAELVRWLALDKQRRGLQWAIYDADLADASEKLAQVTKLRNEAALHPPPWPATA